MQQSIMSCACGRHPLHCIVPPYLLERLAEGPNAKLRRAALDAIASSADARATRRVLQAMPAMAALTAPAAKKHRLVYDAQNKGMAQLPGKLVRSEGDGATGDAADADMRARRLTIELEHADVERGRRLDGQDDHARRRHEQPARFGAGPVVRELAVIPEPPGRAGEVLGADVGDELGVVVLLAVEIRKLEQPRQRMVGVGDEAVDRRGGVVAGFHEP